MYATLDIETTGLNRYKNEITWIGVQVNQDLDDPGIIYTFDYTKKLDRDEFTVLMQQLKEKKARLVWQNGKFDTLFIEQRMRIKLPIHEDVMLMGTAYDLDEKHGLKYMAQKYLGVEDWDISKKEKLSGNKDSVEPYLKLDVKYTWELFRYFRKVMDKKQIRIYKKLLLPAYLTYCQVEKNGIYLNMDEYVLVKKRYEDLEKEWLDKLRSKYPINWNSSQQKQEILFTEKGENLPVLKITPAGKPSADASVMKRLAAQGHEIPQMIIEYQKVNTANKMFLRRYGDDAAWDGRIHPSFNLTNVRSGRTSSSEPNLQQVPNNPDIRNLFTASSEDRVFFEADYSQLELRLAAHFAKEPTMLKIYREDGDIHTETAKIMTGGKEPTKEERKKAKSVNFGFLYGMLAKKFVDYARDSYGVIFTKAEAEAIRQGYFNKYSRLLEWHQEQEEICRALGGVPNLFGRFRKLPKIYAQNRWNQLEAVRRAINSPVQGTGSDILLCAAIEVHKTLSKEGLMICGTIHDSIVGEFYKKDEEWIVPEIQRIMSHPKALDEFGVKLDVELKADVGIGPWGSK